jgi:hypothetical protein
MLNDYRKTYHQQHSLECRDPDQQQLIYPSALSKELRGSRIKIASSPKNTNRNHAHLKKKV